jgi:hypothetical protein
MVPPAGPTSTTWHCSPTLKTFEAVNDLHGKVLNIRVIELIKIYILYYDHFGIWQILNDSNFIFKTYKEKSFFKTLDGFKLVLFSI